MGERKPARTPLAMVTDLRLPTGDADGDQQSADRLAIRSGVGAPAPMTAAADSSGDEPPAGLVDGITVETPARRGPQRRELLGAAGRLAVSVLGLGLVLLLAGLPTDGQLLVGLTVALVGISVVDLVEEVLQSRAVRRCAGCSADHQRVRAADQRLSDCRLLHRLRVFTGVPPVHPAPDVAGLPREEAIERLEQLAETADGYAQQADQFAATVDDEARRSALAYAEVIETLGALHAAFDELAHEIAGQAARRHPGCECGAGHGQGESADEGAQL